MFRRSSIDSDSDYGQTFQVEALVHLTERMANNTIINHIDLIETEEEYNKNQNNNNTDVTNKNKCSNIERNNNFNYDIPRKNNRDRKRKINHSNESILIDTNKMGQNNYNLRRKVAATKLDKKNEMINNESFFDKIFNDNNFIDELVPEIRAVSLEEIEPSIKTKKKKIFRKKRSIRKLSVLEISEDDIDNRSIAEKMFDDLVTTSNLDESGHQYGNKPIYKKTRIRKRKQSETKKKIRKRKNSILLSNEVTDSESDSNTSKTNQLKSAINKENQLRKRKPVNSRCINLSEYKKKIRKQRNNVLQSYLLTNSESDSNTIKKIQLGNNKKKSVNSSNTKLSEVKKKLRKRKNSDVQSKVSTDSDSKSYTPLNKIKTGTLLSGLNQTGKTLRKRIKRTIIESDSSTDLSDTNCNSILFKSSLNKTIMPLLLPDDSTCNSESNEVMSKLKETVTKATDDKVKVKHSKPNIQVLSNIKIKDRYEIITRNTILNDPIKVNNKLENLESIVENSKENVFDINQIHNEASEAQCAKKYVSVVDIIKLKDSVAETLKVNNKLENLECNIENSKENVFDINQINIEASKAQYVTKYVSVVDIDKLKEPITETIKVNNNLENLELNIENSKENVFDINQINNVASEAQCAKKYVSVIDINKLKEPVTKPDKESKLSPAPQSPAKFKRTYHLKNVSKYRPSGSFYEDKKPFNRYKTKSKTEK